jgi:hypothetical protein
MDAVSTLPPTYPVSTHKLTASRTFGNTLSFVNSNGTGGAPNANILQDTTLGSLQEVSLFTNVSCNDDDSCGYVQNGSVAYSKSSFVYILFPLYKPPPSFV